ncbi:hypothetical protein D3C80_1580150 [compost metagenome]
MRAVDPDDPGAQLVGDPGGALQVGAHHGGGQAEAAGVGHLHRLHFGLETLDAQHRAEHFFAPQNAAVARLVEDRRLDEVTFGQMRRAPSAGEQTGATGQSLVDESEHLVILALADQRTQQNPGLHAGANADLAGFLHQPFDQAWGDAFLHQQA